MPMIFEMVVDYEDGRQEEVRADQRDCVAFEMKERIGTTRALDECPMRFFRWIAWHALKRTGQTELAQNVWDAGVISADAADPEEPDPGQPVANAASSSD